MKKRNLMALVLALCLLLPATVWAAGPRTEAIHQISTVPESWDPLKEQSEEAELILSLTADRLYRLSTDGRELTPSLASALPEDVTADYAGTFSVPAGAKRGYAFAIDLNPAARWDDGTPVTAGDWLFTLSLMIDRNLPVPELANLQAFLTQTEVPTDSVISLAEAGFSSVEEAEAAGHTAFYVDTSCFWGLDSGWRSVTDRTALKDAAIPSGVTEMYVSGAYLYDRYLRTGGSHSVFQTEFVGISAQPRFLSWDDVGLLEDGDHRIVLILENPTTAEALALQLSKLVVLPMDYYADNYATSPETYRSTGPWRVVAVTRGEVVLEPNPHWTGATPAADADVIRLTADIGA